jgi:hypothetical protein
VTDAKRVVASRLSLPAGYRLQWTGQYEFLAEMEARLRYVIPLTLVLVVVLLYLSMRGWPQTFLVLSSLPFAVAGSVWLLALMDYHLSTAVWVGLIAVSGVAAETGIVMVVYLDEAFDRSMPLRRPLARTGERPRRSSRRRLQLWTLGLRRTPSSLQRFTRHQPANRTSSIAKTSVPWGAPGLPIGLMLPIVLDYNPPSPTTAQLGGVHHLALSRAPSPWRRRDG